MMEVLWVGVGFVAGLAVASVWFLAVRGKSLQALAEARSRAESAREVALSRANEATDLQRSIESLDARREGAEQRAAVLESELKARDEKFVEERKLREEMEIRLKDAFKAAGSEALARNNEQFMALAQKSFEGLLKEKKGEDDKTKLAIDALVKPIRELLDKQNQTLTDIEKKRLEDKSGLTEQLKQIAQSHEKLNTETSRLVTALRRPEQRGRWGEMQLRNVVELAGMSAHCDFTEQVTTDDPNTRDRPDMIVHIPGEGVIVVDSKVALDAYFDALQPDADRDAMIQRHARHVAEHYRRLSSKEYWNQFERTPKLVVMFMPVESALMAALEVKPDLHADAMKSHVLIATPTLLVALLRAIAYGWRQEDVAANARSIADAGRELYDRVGKFVGDLDSVGTHLTRAGKAYNTAIGSLERRVLPSTRRLKELHATTEAEIEAPPLIETEMRDVLASELRTSENSSIGLPESD